MCVPVSVHVKHMYLFVHVCGLTCISMQHLHNYTHILLEWISKSMLVWMDYEFTFCTFSQSSPIYSLPQRNAEYLVPKFCQRQNIISVTLSCTRFIWILRAFFTCYQIIKFCPCFKESSVYELLILSNSCPVCPDHLRFQRLSVFLIVRPLNFSSLLTIIDKQVLITSETTIPLKSFILPWDVGGSFIVDELF